MRPLRVLFVTPYVPSLLRVRPFNFIRHLARAGHQVTLCAAATTPREIDDADALRTACARVEVVRVPRPRSWWSCARALVTGTPLQARYCYTPVLQRVVDSAVAGGAYDVLHVEHLRAALFALPHADMPHVFDAVDCISALFADTVAHGQSAASRLMARVDLERTRRFEAALVWRFARTLTTTEAQRAALAALGTTGTKGSRDQGIEGVEQTGKLDENRLTVIPNGVDLEHFRPPSGPREPATLVFVGRMSYHANVAAVVHLVETIMPRIWAARGDTRVLVVGEAPAPRVRRLARQDPRVEVTGTVPDVRPYVARATVAVCPVVYGVGVQNKLLEAMAMATPAVASTTSAGGLGARDGEHLLVAADDARFAAHVLCLLDDEALRQRLGVAGRRFVEAEHDWGASTRLLETVYAEEMGRARRPIGGAVAASA